MVHILCVDVNDNCPVLESGSMYTTSILENTPVGALLTLVLYVYIMYGVCICVSVCACVCVISCAVSVLCVVCAYVVHFQLWQNLFYAVGSINLCNRCRYHCTIPSSAIPTCS